MVWACDKEVEAKVKSFLRVYFIDVICFLLYCYSLFIRVTAATKMNDVSSRSHAIFTINFTQVIL